MNTQTDTHEALFERFTVTLPLQAAIECSHSGACDADVARHKASAVIPIAAWNNTVAISGPKPTPRQMRNLRDWALYHRFTLQDSTNHYIAGVLQ